jgi:hypothetical protein
MPRTAARVTQADIARAIRAVVAAGVPGWAVSIRPDGTIVIGPVEPSPQSIGVDRDPRSAAIDAAEVFPLC